MRRILRLLAVIGVFAIHTSRLAAQEPAKATSESPRGDAWKELCYEDVTKVIETLSVKSIEELLPNLPPDVRGDYVLMTQSKSSHVAAALAPRVVLCSPTARLMMAYSTDKSDENRHMLEIIQWRDDTDQYEFREIAFDPQGRAAPKFSEANPSRCTACHGDSMRPNWEPAGKWPGALGQGRSWEEHEIKRHTTLSQRKDPRLGALEWSKPTVGTQTPSAVMARRTNVLNMRRFARFLHDSQNYQEYKFAIVAGLLAMPEFLRVEPIRSLYLDRPEDYDDRLKETKKTLSTLLHEYYSPVDADSIASMRMIFEPRKISLRDVSTSFRNPILMTGNTRTDFHAVVVDLYAMDPELREAAPLPSAEQMFRRGTERERFGALLVKVASQKDYERRQKSVDAALRLR